MPLRVHLTPQLTPLILVYKTAMQTLAPKVPAFSLKPTAKFPPRLTFRTLSSPPLPAAKVSMPLPVFSSSSLDNLWAARLNSLPARDNLRGSLRSPHLSCLVFCFTSSFLGPSTCPVRVVCFSWTTGVVSALEEGVLS
ncbi:hypothetical protein AMECASPLE_036963 [Ameca splendens]|uniref:Uncharacterized protein n=1 Tax=Ameca splendens TaxID=208324 RepID=A0ABV0XWR0_9TELE